MSEEQKGYGFVSDTDESVASKSRPDFGINFGSASVKSIEYKENVAKEGNEEREAIEMIVKVKDKEEKVWFGPINKVFGDGGEIGPDHKDYKENLKAAKDQQAATLVHWLKALGAIEEDLKREMSKKHDSFESYAKSALSCISENYSSRNLDLFYEYQYTIKTGKNGEPNEKTYPQIPRNMKGGYFVVPAQPGEWREVRGSDGSLKYVDAEGNEHPIKRTGDFMSSPKGTQQFLGGEEEEEDNPMDTNPEEEVNKGGW